MSNELTKNQQEAIKHYTGPALVIAGPGAGKTYIITERISFLINNKNVKPEQIVVTTFTEKASNELKVRLARSLGRNAERIHISTIHSFCKNMLEHYFQYHNYGAQINLLDEESQYLYLDQNKQKLGFASWKNGKFHYVKNGVRSSSDFIKGVASFYNIMTQNEIDPEILLEELKKNTDIDQGDEKLIISYKKYKDQLDSEKLMDFANLQTCFHNLIKIHTIILQDIQNTLPYVLIDEYQDTSPIQDRIFRLIAGEKQNIFVVGDKNQSIYGFRGATIRNFTNFIKRYPKAKTYFLDVNFRSTETIVNFSNKVFDAGVKKELRAQRRSGEKIRLIVGNDVDNSGQQTIQAIKKMKKNGMINSYGDVALLFRSLKGHAKEYIKYLQKENIPFVTFGDGKFFSREEIRVIIYMLSYIYREDNDDSCAWTTWKDWWRKDLFLTEFFDLSQSSKDVITKGDFNLRKFRLKDEFKEVGFIDDGDIEKLKNINGLIDIVENRKKAYEEYDDNKTTLFIIFYNLIEYSGYFKRLMNDSSPESQEKLYNLARFTNIIKRYIEITGKETVKHFLWYLNNREYDFDQEKLERDDTVKLMTVHKSKGMEFPVVFVCSLLERRFPLQYRSNEFVHIPKMFLDKDSIDPEEEHLQEERRLFYVALTRAQDNLIFTTSEKISRQKATMSRFLSLLNGEYLENDEFKLPVEKKYSLSKGVPNLNYSAINTYIICPLRYKLIYEYGFEYPSVYIQIIGNFVHNTLQKINEYVKKKKNISNTELRSIINNNWINLPISKKKNEKIRDGYIEKFTAYYTTAKEEFKDILAIEESFSFIDDKMIIRGKVDIIIRDRNDNVCLIDFKVHSMAGIEKTNVEKQLQIYNYCLNEKYHIDKLIAYTFKDNQKVEFPQIENSKINAFLKDMSEKFQMNNFPQNFTDFCNQCQFNFYCKG